MIKLTGYIIDNRLCFFIFIFLLSLLSLPRFIAAQNQQQQNLHEPVRPVPPPETLNPARLRLGEKLFHEPRLSHNNDMSCASCHNLSTNGADQQQYTTGRDGVLLDVNTPTVFNSSLNYHQFWDGRARSLEEQIDFVIASKKEMASNWPEIISKLRQDEDYLNDFGQLYSDGITAENIRDAIAIFEHSLTTHNSRFDRFLMGESDAISANEKKGYTLFKSYGCIACHQGSNVGGNLFMKFGVFGDYFSERGNITPADLGRYNVTGKDRDRYVFRVPSLRLAALTAPYFHDGSVKTLEQAVKIMAHHQLGREIPRKEIECIVAFLKTLPGEYNGQPLSGTNQPEEKAGNP